ncbi:connector enhancer of kinase suppressor of ras 1 isoform X1 [Esox lucius]|uniref:Connector enhancer of kinase suppressor of Ras 1 n=1 Tax=Esox lucius TaxID=8010 RepID=A0AAY5L845_ESOLU|nr:connector enhancer of kinase suppressor of ras 1 isoform X1 [Esox lucius]
MEPITSWSKEKVRDWLKGLEAPLQQYPFKEWQVTGLELLQLSAQDLERLGVHKIGHQELIFEAVEKLCTLTYGMGGENLRCLTEKLRLVAQSMTMGIQIRWRVNTYDGRSATKLPASILEVVLELITSAKGLFSLLNRYQFAKLSGVTASKNIITYCKDLGATVHKDATVFEKEKDIISICRQLVAVCDEILTCCPEDLLAHTAQLESVDLVPVSPGDQLGVQITSTGSSNHYVTGTIAESPAEFCEKILAGDEVIQVNDQIVVGWSRRNLVKKLEENPTGVSLVLKRLPVTPNRKDTTPRSFRQKREEEQEEEVSPRHSIFNRVTASVRSLSFRAAVQEPESVPPMGQEESELSVEKGVDGSLTLLSEPDLPGELSNLSAGEAEGLEGSRLSPGSRGEVSFPPASPCPRVLQLGRASISSCPEMGHHGDEKEPKKTSVKGKTTAMSRRRVSCRELGRPECDGWLWKKRKESSVFMTQKWQRFWFVLKGPSLYWYTSQQEEKAEGLIHISSYNIESAGEHKRKFVFQMCHQRFQTFFFAAENVSDMSKWINCLITAIQKHKKNNKGQPDSEEECYSETESEEEASYSPSPRRTKIYTKTLSNTLPRAKKEKEKKTKTIVNPPTLARSRSPGAPEDEMGVLFHRLKEGGVSLIGSSQPVTHDHFRRSFIRRNKNPVINEKVHTLRALHSTLKDREAELQLINKVLEDPELTPQKYRLWKDHNQDLHLEIQKLAVQRAAAVTKETTRGVSEKGQGSPTGLSPGETVAVETEGAYGLSLSDGEMLVDAESSMFSSEEKNAMSDSDVEPAEIHPKDARASSLENYFYI